MNEIALQNNSEFNLPDVKTIKNNIRDNFEGLTPQFISVKFPTGGVTSWEIDDDVTKSLEGIIVDHYPIRGLFLSPNSTVPDCRSTDGIKGVGLCSQIEPKDCICANCTYNQWGSFKTYIKPEEISGKKACNEKHRIFLLRSGEMLPIMIALPSTSIRPLAIYMTKLASKNRPVTSVITKVTLEKVTKNNMDYAIAQFTKINELPDNISIEVSNLSKFLKPYCRNKPIEVEETIEPF